MSSHHDVLLAALTADRESLIFFSFAAALPLTTLSLAALSLTDEWYATEASASSSTTNCGCDPSWKNEGKGCVVGGGTWERKALECTNYWGPSALPVSAGCEVTNTSTRSCVANLTQKIEGDDTQHMMDVFEDFVTRHKDRPWLAQLSVHTNHEPHPSLPEWYHNYTEAEGGPAGDYLGKFDGCC